jgi:hypothetical protein
MVERVSAVIDSWRKLFSLPASRWGWLVRAHWLFPYVSLSLRVRGLPKTLAAVRKPGIDLDGQAPPGVDEALEMARMVNIAAHRGLFRPKCLTRSVTLLAMLHRARFPAELHIGSRKDGAGLDAHAWVEAEGLVLNDSREKVQAYQRFHGETDSVF